MVRKGFDAEWDCTVATTSRKLVPELPAHTREAELHALVSVSIAVGGAHSFEEVLEVAAEETMHAVGAASASISRWEREHARARTLINVGELGPEEERWPEEELYAIADYPVMARVLERAEPQTVHLADSSLSEQDRALLESLCKGSGLAVPIVYRGAVWGELEVFFHAPTRPDQQKASFLEAIGAQLAMALQRGEAFSRVVEQVLRDDMTGVHNRRGVTEALEPMLAEAQAGGSDLACLFCDLDGLKALNDGEGHDKGDAALRCVAQILDRAASATPGAVVGRLGGDEFCVLLPGAALEPARTFGQGLVDAVARADCSVTLSCGVTALDPTVSTALDLLRAADGAQYAAKRAGGGRVAVARPDGLSGRLDSPGQTRRRLRDEHPEPHRLHPARLSALRATGLLDTPPEPVFERFTDLARQLLETPVALISLIDRDRQFFKSANGLAEPWASRGETPLSHSFCKHVVASGRPLVVADARGHALVRDNLAIPELGVIAYAGVPLTMTNGHTLGALCAIDGSPHEWSPREVELLERLAAGVIAEVEIRHATGRLEWPAEPGA